MPKTTKEIYECFNKFYFKKWYPEEEMKETNEILLDLLLQSCEEDDGKIDNRCTMAYENACKHLKEKGYLTKIDDRFYKV